MKTEYELNMEKEVTKCLDNIKKERTHFMFIVPEKKMNTQLWRGLFESSKTTPSGNLLITLNEPYKLTPNNMFKRYSTFNCFFTINRNNILAIQKIKQQIQKGTRIEIALIQDKRDKWIVHEIKKVEEWN